MFRRKKHSIDDAKNDSPPIPLDHQKSEGDDIMVYVRAYLDNYEKKTAAEMLMQLWMAYFKTPNTPSALRDKLDQEAADLKVLFEQEKHESSQPIRPFK